MKHKKVLAKTSFKTRLILFNFNVLGGLGIKPYEKFKQLLKQCLMMPGFCVVLIQNQVLKFQFCLS